MSKQRLQITVREDLVKWMDQEIEKLRFANRSHAVEFALLQLVQAETLLKQTHAQRLKVKRKEDHRKEGPPVSVPSRERGYF